MSNQAAVHSDKEFYLAQIDHCLAICAFLVDFGELDQGDFREAKKIGLTWLSMFCERFYHTPTEASDIEDQFYELNYQFQLKAHGLNEAIKDLKNVEQPKVRPTNDSVAQPVASTQLSVLRVLGQVSKTQSYSRPADSLSRHWLPAPASAAGLFSSTRSIGGLGQ